MMLHDLSGAGVPAEQGVFVAGWTQFHGFLELLHRVVKELVGDCFSARCSPRQTSVSSALGDDAGVVQALVFVLESRQDFLSAANAFSDCTRKLIGQGKQQRDESPLVIRRDRQDVKANA